MIKYNEAIMQAVRQRLDLDKDDISEDETIMGMPKENVFAEYCKWHGLLGTIEDIYDINLLEK